MYHFIIITIIVAALNDLHSLENPEKAYRVLACFGKKEIKSLQYDLSLTAFNILGKIIFIKRVNTLSEALNIHKFGEYAAIGTGVKIINGKRGDIHFEFEGTTAGSFLQVVGIDTKVKEYTEIPMGIFEDRNTGSYFLILP
jgi:hypothetical protein